MMVQMLILLVGFFLLVKGADWFVEGAASIAKKLGIPQLVIGLTIVAMGTSLPEAAVSITAALDNNAGITIGNIVGSNILNILIILGITAVITNVSIQKSTFCYEIPFMLIITVILMIFGITGSKITFMEGVIFWILFLLYLGYLYIMSKKGTEQEEENVKDIPPDQKDMVSAEAVSAPASKSITQEVKAAEQQPQQCMEMSSFHGAWRSYGSNGK